MRPENQWFKPEKLQAYLYLYEAIVLLIAVGVVAVVVAAGALAEVPEWALAVAGGVVLLVFAYLTWWIRAFFRTAEYRFTDDEIEYNRGVFFQQKTTVPYNRITNVDAHQGPVQRLVDAGSVGVHTAGYGGQMGAELTIGGVSDYEEIKEQVLAKVRRGRPLATEGEEPTEIERVPRAGQSAETGDVIAELRRIRELLERERTA